MTRTKGDKVTNYKAYLSALPYLYPQTSSRPIKLDEYLAQENKSRLVDDERLTDEWKAWYDARVR